MPARRPNIVNAAIEFALLLTMLVCGALGAGLAVAVGILLAMALYWALSRRAALAQMPMAKRLTQSLLATLIMVGAGALAYMLGLNLRGMSQ